MLSFLSFVVGAMMILEIHGHCIAAGLLDCGNDTTIHYLRLYICKLTAETQTPYRLVVVSTMEAWTDWFVALSLCNDASSCMSSRAVVYALHPCLCCLLASHQTTET